MPDELVLQKEETDSFAEICNIGFGAPANELTGRLKGQVKFAPPKVTVSSLEEAAAALQDKSVVCRFGFSGDYAGEWLFALDVGTAEKIAGRMLETKINFASEAESASAGAEAVLSMMREIMHMGEQVLSESIKRSIAFNDGTISVNAPSQISLPELFAEGLVKIVFRFKVAEVVDSTMISLVAIPFVRATVADFERAIMDQMEGFSAVAQPVAEADDSADAVLAPVVRYCREHLGDFNRVSAINITVALQLAKKRMSFGELWSAGKGGLILKFERPVSEPAQVVFGSRVLAKAQVVTVGDHFGAKIMEVNR